MEEYIGKCPLCSGQLVPRVVAHEGFGGSKVSDTLLECSGCGKYATDKNYFEDTWARFEGNHIKAEGLLSRLVDGNLFKEDENVTA